MFTPWFQESSVEADLRCSWVYLQLCVGRYKLEAASPGLARALGTVMRPLSEQGAGRSLNSEQAALWTGSRPLSEQGAGRSLNSERLLSEQGAGCPLMTPVLQRAHSMQAEHSSLLNRLGRYQLLVIFLSIFSGKASVVIIALVWCVIRLLLHSSCTNLELFSKFQDHVLLLNSCFVFRVMEGSYCGYQSVAQTLLYLYNL